MKKIQRMMTPAAGILALFVFGGCENKVVQTERDAEGNTEIHVDGNQVDKNFEAAERNFDKAGRELKESAGQLGDAVQRGAERVEAEVGPVVRDVLDDASVTAKVKARLIADPEVRAFNIDVDTVDGRVTLNGKVSADEFRDEAEKLTRRTEGVKEVLNLIQVEGAEQGTR